MTAFRWDDEAIAIVEEVAAQKLHSTAARAEIARRLGLPRVTDDQIRNALRRRDMPLQYAATGRPPRHQEEDTPTSPSTERSRRMSDAPGQWKSSPSEQPCRAFVAPMGVREPGPEDHERVLCIPDVHFGAHDQRACDLALEIAAAVKPTAIVVLGDLLDGAALSTHDRTRKVASLMDEVEAARPFLRALEGVGARFLAFCEGNHEYRLARLLHTHASALADLPGMNVDALLGLTEHGWRYVPYHHGIDIGEVHYTHDVGHCGAHAVRQSLVRRGSSLVIGHVHTTSVVEMTNHDGKPMVGASFGCLLDTEQVDYRSVPMARREWTKAVGVMHGGERGYHAAQTITIRDGGRLAYYEGRALRAAA